MWEHDREVSGRGRNRGNSLRIFRSLGNRQGVKSVNRVNLSLILVADCMNPIRIFASSNNMNGDMKRILFLSTLAALAPDSLSCYGKDGHTAFGSEHVSNSVKAAGMFLPQNPNLIPLDKNGRFFRNRRNRNR